MALRPLTTTLPLPGAITPRSIIIDKNWYKIDISYSAEAHLYCSAQPSVFSHIVLNVDVSTFCYFSSSIKSFLCAVLVAASCLLSFEK